MPFILLLQQGRIWRAEWEIDEPAFFKLVEQGWRVIRTSAKTGEGVEEAFETAHARDAGRMIAAGIREDRHE